VAITYFRNLHSNEYRKERIRVEELGTSSKWVGDTREICVAAARKNNDFCFKNREREREREREGGQNEREVGPFASTSNSKIALTRATIIHSSRRANNDLSECVLSGGGARRPAQPEKSNAGEWFHSVKDLTMSYLRCRGSIRGVKSAYETDEEEASERRSSISFRVLCRV